MLRTPLKPTRLAVVVQVASLLLIASGMFGILASDIRYRAEGAQVETRTPFRPCRTKAYPGRQRLREWQQSGLSYQLSSNLSCRTVGVER